MEGSAEWGGELELRALVSLRRWRRAAPFIYLAETFLSPKPKRSQLLETSGSRIPPFIFLSTSSIHHSIDTFHTFPLFPQKHQHSQQCHALRVPITVYSAEAPPLQMGHDEYGEEAPPLLLTCVRADNPSPSCLVYARGGVQGEERCSLRRVSQFMCAVGGKEEGVNRSYCFCAAVRVCLCHSIIDWNWSPLHEPCTPLTCD